MNKQALKESMLLYLVTDRAWLGSRELVDVVEDAVLGGVTFVQLREKNLSYREFLSEAIAIKKVTDKYKIPFVINDNIDVAIASGADGVHIGQSDATLCDARSRLGDQAIIGVSVSDIDQAKIAEQNGASYLGVGAMWSTATKTDVGIVSIDKLIGICEAVSIPVVAIGGIKMSNIDKLYNTGIDGVAVVSAILAEDDITYATKNIRKYCSAL